VTVLTESIIRSTCTVVISASVPVSESCYGNELAIDGDTPKKKVIDRGTRCRQKH
jgi:hypothetical protein